MAALVFTSNATLTIPLGEQPYHGRADIYNRFYVPMFASVGGLQETPKTIVRNGDSFISYLKEGSIINKEVSLQTRHCSMQLSPLLLQQLVSPKGTRETRKAFQQSAFGTPIRASRCTTITSASSTRLFRGASSLGQTIKTK